MTVRKDGEVIASTHSWNEQECGSVRRRNEPWMVLSASPHLVHGFHGDVRGSPGKEQLLILHGLRFLVFVLAFLDFYRPKTVDVIYS